jgi:septal ring factor EnvC (AmiA/AmiB activator)
MHFFPAFLIFIWLCTIPSQPLAQNISTKPIQRHKISIGKLRKEIERHQGKVVQSDKKEKNILGELEDIDVRIKKQIEKIASIEEQVAQQNALIEARQLEIIAIDEEKSTLQAHLVNRLRSYYFRGKTNFLKVTFSQKNLPDLLVFDDAFHNLIIYDREIIEAYREKKNQIQIAKQVHELEKSIKIDFLQQAEEEKKSLDFIASEKNTLLKQTKSQKSLYALALKEMQKAEGDLTATIIQLKKKQEKRSKGFLRSKGKLPVPVQGTLQSTFQTEGAEISPLRNGITIKTVDGAKVHAIYDGKVIYAGYMKGFGKTVIIDHGRQYYTVTSRLDSIRSKKGTKIKSKQMIGTTGNIATLFGRGLYFEIRHGSTPEDPLLWLQPDSLRR